MNDSRDVAHHLARSRAVEPLLRSGVEDRGSMHSCLSLRSEPGGGRCEPILFERGPARPETQAVVGSSVGHVSTGSEGNTPVLKKGGCLREDGGQAWLLLAGNGLAGNNKGNNNGLSTVSL